MYPIRDEIEQASKALAGREAAALKASDQQAKLTVAENRTLALALIGFNLLAIAGVLAAYHLIVVFDEDYVNDEWIGATLDHARPVLAGLIPTLPPLDGGGRSADVAEGREG